MNLVTIKQPIDWEDDCEVEAYKAALAQRERERAAKVDEQRVILRAENADTAQALSTVVQIVTNIEYGDSPLALSSAFIMACREDMTMQDALVVICVRDKYQPTEDCKLLESLCTADETEPRPSHLLQSLMTECKDLEAAVPALVDSAVNSGKAPKGDADRLKDLYTVWLRGVTWDSCKITASNGPTLASWNGWPWDALNLMERALARGVKGKNVRVFCDAASPIEEVDPARAHMFKLIWSAEQGPVPSVAQATRDAVAERVTYNHEKIEASLADGEEADEAKGGGRGKKSPAARKGAPTKRQRTKK